jgi:glutathione S-transferase
MSELRIFTYLPNPRLWKSTIAARLCGVTIEIRGCSAKHLNRWLWDFDAHEMTTGEQETMARFKRSARKGFSGDLFKTDSFLLAQPFGTVPTAFSPDEHIGIFESNSIMRAVARLGQDRFPLYGSTPYEASRIDGFLDVSLIFAQAVQAYLLNLSSDNHARAKEAFDVYGEGIERALSSGRPFLVGDQLSLADICFVAELALFLNEKRRIADLHHLEPILSADSEKRFPRLFDHFYTLCRHQAFSPDLAPHLESLSLSRPQSRG